MPGGIKFTGQFGDSFPVEMTPCQVIMSRSMENPVAIVDLEELNVVEIKPGSEYPRIEELLSVPR